MQYLFSNNLVRGYRVKDEKLFVKWAIGKGMKKSFTFLVSSFLAIMCLLSASAQPIQNKNILGSLTGEQPVPLEVDLAQFEKKVFSQNGEDGVITKIFQTIGVTNRYFVEFGVEGGRDSNSRNLLDNFGWKGLMMDRFHENATINLKRECITAGNCGGLLEKYTVPAKFDLLSIDVDYNDFYVWQALKNYHPRVVVIEYNATHLPNVDQVVLYSPKYEWDGSNYYGASILSMTKLGKTKGYTLIYAESKGVNLFFVRDDVLKKIEHRVVFKNQGLVEKIYRQPTYGGGPNGGHSEDPQHRKYVTFEQACASSTL